ncbi:MAG: LD-carboxypeptidase [Sphingobacteriales bacterium]|nr:LD-carboxypeptidase [Sphingobacteriales bacterium]
MIRPPVLKENDAIGIVSPSGKILPELVLNAADVLSKYGFCVETGKYVFNTHHQFAGTDGERLEDFQRMLDDPEIKAILCSRGGYGAIRIIENLDFTSFCKKPKWIIGFSDITIFHAHLNNRLNTMSIHGPMTRMIAEQPDNESVRFLMAMLKGEKLNYSIPVHPFNHKGEVIGKLTGGNLAILTSLIGTPCDFNPDGKILFIEDIGEYLYRIDRMMWQLKLSGKLKGLKGLIVGQFTDMKDNNIPFGQTAYEIIASHLKDLDIPVVFGFPAGHEEVNWSLTSGANYRLQVDSEKVQLEEIQDTDI